MSALAGRLTFDGSPIPPELRRQFIVGLQARAGDSSAATEHPGCLVAFSAAYCAPGEETASQPSQSGTAITTFVGRLDNRTEIAARCGLGPVPTTTPDIVLVDAAYETFGTKCIGDFVGDFALAFVDQQRRAVWLARDAFGTRPLFYSATDRHVTWSTELELLVDVLKCPRTLDDDFVAGYLTTREDWQVTPYRAIRAVPPGTLMELCAAGVRRDIFWQPDADRCVRCKTDAEYEDAFRTLFDEGIAARLRSTRPVLAELSGGLDSSSIVCAAHRQVTQRLVPAPDVMAVSFLYPGSPSSDETRFMTAVDEYVGRPAIRIGVTDILSSLRTIGRLSIPNPAASFNVLFKKLDEFREASGARILMSGHGGDTVMMHALSFPFLADFLRRGELRMLSRYLQGLHQQWKLAYVHLLWTSVLWPLIPRRVRARVPSGIPPMPAWIDKTFAARTNVAQRWLSLHTDVKAQSCAAESLVTSLRDAVSTTAACYYRERIRLDVTYPYLHRPLVEFMLGIPPEQIIRPNELRSIQRRAFRGLMPEIVRKRTSKAGQNEVMCRALAREWPNVKTLVDSSALVAGGYVDGHRFHEELQRARFGLGDHIQPLYRTLVLDAWLRGAAA